ncbi:MAG: thermonuclease family protein [Anaerolineales bacterium]|nr:thermonuclease family protein [Anaerolineales bacterium]
MNLYSQLISFITGLCLLFSTTSCSSFAGLLQASATPAPLNTATRQPTLAGVFAYTHTPTLEITLTPSATGTATPLPTITVTPSPSPSPTIDALACLPAEEAEYGRVRWVSDGDTIVVEIDESLYSVRYLGIDAPAFIPSVEYMGPLAKERNIELVDGRVVRLFKGAAERDRFGQLLRYVVVEGGVFVNFQLALEGLARAQATPPGGACAAILQQAEQIARQAQLGVWKATPTRRPTFTPVPSVTRSASPTSTPTSTPTPTLSGSITPSLTPTATETISGTLTTTPTPSSTATSTASPGPESATPTPSPSPTP